MTLEQFLALGRLSVAVACGLLVVAELVNFLCKPEEKK